MLGRGRQVKAVAETLGVNPRTVSRWRRVPAFAAEEERARASAERPSPRGVLLDALMATRNDGVDWPSRLAAARALLANGAELLEDARPAQAGPHVTVVERIPA